MHPLRPSSGEMWLGVKSYSSIPHLGERRTGWRWITKIGSWLEVRCKHIVLNGGYTLHGWRWDNTHGTWMQVRQVRQLGHGSIWDAHLETCMGLKWDLNVAEILLSRFVWNWDVTCMKVRQDSWNRFSDEIAPGWRWDTNLASWIG